MRAFLSNWYRELSNKIMAVTITGIAAGYNAKLCPTFPFNKAKQAR